MTKTEMTLKDHVDVNVEVPVTMMGDIAVAAGGADCGETLAGAALLAEVLDRLTDESIRLAMPWLSYRLGMDLYEDLLHRRIHYIAPVGSLELMVSAGSEAKGRLAEIEAALSPSEPAPAGEAESGPPPTAECPAS